jgi:hypothetical protein
MGYARPSLSIQKERCFGKLNQFPSSEEMPRIILLIWVRYDPAPISVYGHTQVRFPKRPVLPECTAMDDVGKMSNLGTHWNPERDNGQSRVCWPNK